MQAFHPEAEQAFDPGQFQAPTSQKNQSLERLKRPQSRPQRAQATKFRRAYNAQTRHMGLPYMPIHWGGLGVNVGIHGSPMECMGCGLPQHVSTQDERQVGRPIWANMFRRGRPWTALARKAKSHQVLPTIPPPQNKHRILLQESAIFTIPLTPKHLSYIKYIPPVGSQLPLRPALQLPILSDLGGAA